ncbi:hypothetical protein [Paraburkholderia tropica]|uniref:hypothetical protein n=1 Tax=Paraburkholderia tropica TaxID=92647 RepID=UPI00160C9CAE|nr:hypothetical protein [Paraburkholderia tropica]MBB6319270.1 hypothetical protein [Paraburkholderia tropica]
MAERIPVSDLDIAREHRLGRFPGSAADAITNPAMRICLTNLAEMRKKREQPADQLVDGKRLAAGDSE